MWTTALFMSHTIGLYSHAMLIGHVVTMTYYILSGNMEHGKVLTKRHSKLLHDLSNNHSQHHNSNSFWLPRINTHPLP